MRRINYKSDIPPLLLSLKVDENQITVPDCDFIVRFYIDGYEGRHYDCSHIGGAWSNCEPSDDGTKLVCYINNQRLGIGELCAEFHYISPDRRYSDGSQKSVVVIGSTELGVELVEDNGDAVTEAAIDVTLPFIYRTAYEIARYHGYTGTAEDFYGALASVVGIAEAEAGRVSSEELREANEQQRVREFDAMKYIVDELEGKVDGVVEDEKSFEDAIRDQVNNYKPIVIEGNVTNAADEEDITSENGLLKLKGRSALNGMGYVILRQNKDFAEQVIKANTIYEIRYDFDLNGEEITIPENCVLKFNGGSFKNGILNGNSAYIDNKENTLIFKDVKINNCISDTVSSDWFFTYRNGYQYTSIDKTGYTVNGVQYPLKTYLPLSYNDDTWNLQQLLNIDANTYIIEDGIYMINPDKNDSEGIDDNRYGGLKFKGKSNKKIQIKGVLKAIPSQIGKGSLFRLQECNNVILCGNGTFQGDLGEVLKDGEFGTFGIFINSSSYITIRDLTFEYFSIDGVYISWRKYRSDTDHNIQHHHVIDNITCRCNRRTGLVYEIGDYVVIKNSNFISNGTVRGAATYSGIDIEPFGDASAPKRYCRNFLIKNNKFITNGGTGLRTERCLDTIIYGNYFYRNSKNIELHRSFYSTEDITDSSNKRYISGKSYVYNNFFDGGSTINANYSNGCVDFYNNFCINQGLILDGQWIYSNFYNNLIINCVRFGSITAIDTNIYSNLVEGISMSSEKYLSGNNSPIFIRLQKSKNVKIYNNNLYYCRGKVIEGAGDKGNTPLPFTEFKNYPYMIDEESISTTQIYNNYIDHRYFGEVLTKANIYGNIAINNSIEENDLYICYSGDTIISNKYKQKGIVTKNARVKVDDECIEFSANLEVSKNTKICNSERTKMFVAITDGTLGDTFPSGYSSGTCMTTPLPLTSPKIVWCNTGICTSETRPNFLNSVGRRLLETDTNLLIEYNGKAWSVISNNYKGRTNQRPLLGNNDLGVEYYDTTIKKKIVWDGTKWVNIDGTDLI